MNEPGSGNARLPLPGVGRVFLAWAPASSVEKGDAWLTPAEAAIVERFRVSRRAADWRLGRWVAKEAIARALASAADDAADHDRAAARAVAPAKADLEILAGPGGSPRARVLRAGEWPAVAVSLSHAAGVGFAVAAVSGREGRIGCDVEEVAPRSEEFVSDYFTAEEAAWIRSGGGDRPLRANLLWSAKEAALKALGEGLRKDTREVVVDVDGIEAGSLEGAAGAWLPLGVAAPAGVRFAGWWRVAEGLVWTVVG